MHTSNMITPNGSNSKNAQVLYFKILNISKLYAEHDSEVWESYKEYEYEYNTELQNDYYECAWFRSELDIETLKLQLFCSMINRVRITGLYNNPQTIQDYFEEHYNLNIFFNSNSELDADHAKAFAKVEDDVLIQDISNQLIANLKYKLILPIEQNDLLPNRYYIFRTWEFYCLGSELFLKNLLLNDFLRVDYQATPSFETLAEAISSGLSVLLECDWEYYDVQLRGFDYQTKLRNSPFLDDTSPSRKIAKIERTLPLKKWDANDTSFVLEYNRFIREVYKMSFLPYEVIATHKGINTINYILPPSKSSTPLSVVHLFWYRLVMLSKDIPEIASTYAKSIQTNVANWNKQRKKNSQRGSVKSMNNWLSQKGYKSLDKIPLNLRTEIRLLDVDDAGHKKLSEMIETLPGYLEKLAEDPEILNTWKFLYNLSDCKNNNNTEVTNTPVS